MQINKSSNISHIRHSLRVCAVFLLLSTKRTIWEKKFMINQSIINLICCVDWTLRCWCRKSDVEKDVTLDIVTCFTFHRQHSNLLVLDFFFVLVLRSFYVRIFFSFWLKGKYDERVISQSCDTLRFGKYHLFLSFYFNRFLQLQHHPNDIYVLNVLCEIKNWRQLPDCDLFFMNLSSIHSRNKWEPLWVGSLRERWRQVE